MATGERRTASGSLVVTGRKRHWLFDRPKPPRDWRWVVGWIGKVLIIVGLLMFAFVAYQLWGTGIYTAQAQNELDDQFDQAGIAATTVPPSEVSTTVVAATTSSSPPVPTGAPTTVPATTTTAPATTTIGPATVPFPFSDPATGDVVARLQIPGIGVDYKIVQGVAVKQLAKGPGHFPESVLPGQLGNAAIAGHRTTHGAPFLHVDRLDPGDTIVITYPDIGGVQGPQFTYVVTATDIVSPGDYADVVPTLDPSRATLVLASCHPVTSATERIIVRADLDPARSSTLFEATPRPGVDGPQVLPGDDGETTTATTDTATGTTAPATPATTTASAPASTVAASPAPPTASEDAFAGGWFEDTAAWPHIVLWGLLLAAICWGGYVLAKRQRRIWLGLLTAVVPFVVVLYFWFENVNRLLPPGI